MGKLLDFRGRSRTPQIELARLLGIDNYESPGGGCVLTDVNQARRIKEHYLAAATGDSPVRVADILIVAQWSSFSPARWLYFGVGAQRTRKHQAACQSSTR
ncbi:MAG: hypothetical protein EYX74_07485 [Desulfobulbaceae bacterium]|nr:MAG: hypothetical protein EYX74_07485 [Desulfobulbaceae bacterium]